MPNELLHHHLFKDLPSDVTEIRVRKRRRLTYLTTLRRVVLDHVVTDAEFEDLLSVVTDRSLYALTEKLTNGYLPLKGGIRVGVAGEGVLDGDRIKTVRHVTSLAIRIPHQIFGIADFLGIDRYFRQNVLIVSPPAGGKTTLLREIARKLSDHEHNVVLLDERGEISGAGEGGFAMKIGENTDVLFGFPKRIAYENALRAMNPDYIVTDELSGEGDVEGVLRAYYGGVKVIATLHGDTTEAFRGVFSPLTSVFDRIVLLSKKPTVGTVKREILK